MSELLGDDTLRHTLRPVVMGEDEFQVHTWNCEGCRAEFGLKVKKALASSELQVLRLVLKGLSNAQIAEIRVVSVKTVEAQVSRIRIKFEIDAARVTRLALLAPALERYGLAILEPGSPLRTAMEALP